MFEQYAVLTIITIVAIFTLIRWTAIYAKTRKNKRPNQDLQPLLGVVWPEETKTKRKK